MKIHPLHKMESPSETLFFSPTICKKSFWAENTGELLDLPKVPYHRFTLHFFDSNLENNFIKFHAQRYSGAKYRALLSLLVVELFIIFSELIIAATEESHDSPETNLEDSSLAKSVEKILLIFAIAATTVLLLLHMRQAFKHTTYNAWLFDALMAVTLAIVGINPNLALWDKLEFNGWQIWAFALWFAWPMMAMTLFRQYALKSILYILAMAVHYSFEFNVMSCVFHAIGIPLAIGYTYFREEMIRRDFLSAVQYKIEEVKLRQLLLRMLPAKIIPRLLKHELVAEKFDLVTILFAEICDFSSQGSKMQPVALLSLLNQLFLKFDELTDRHHVFKVESVGHIYMVAGGLPNVSQGHSIRVAQLAIAMQQACQELSWPDGSPMCIKIGIHCSSVVAGVIGEKLPRYRLFGDTVNTASRMCSSGHSRRIHISAPAESMLRHHFVIALRGEIKIKGKGVQTTYWLTSAKKDQSTLIMSTNNNININNNNNNNNNNATNYGICSPSPLMTSQNWDEGFNPMATGSPRTLNSSAVPADNASSERRNSLLLPFHGGPSTTSTPRDPPEFSIFNAAMLSANSNNNFGGSNGGTSNYATVMFDAGRINIDSADEGDEASHTNGSEMASSGIDDRSPNRRLRPSLSIRLPPELKLPDAAPSARVSSTAGDVVMLTDDIDGCKGCDENLYEDIELDEEEIKANKILSMSLGSLSDILDAYNYLSDITNETTSSMWKEIPLRFQDDASEALFDEAQKIRPVPLILLFSIGFGTFVINTVVYSLGKIGSSWQSIRGCFIWLSLILLVVGAFVVSLAFTCAKRRVLQGNVAAVGVWLLLVGLTAIDFPIDGSRSFLYIWPQICCIVFMGLTPCCGGCVLSSAIAIAVFMVAHIVVVGAIHAQRDEFLALFLICFLSIRSQYEENHRRRRTFVITNEVLAEQIRSRDIVADLIPDVVAKELVSAGGLITSVKSVPRHIVCHQLSEVSIMFADMVGFTAMSSDLSPEQLVSLLQLVFAFMDELAEKYGVFKVETIGDCLFAASGVPHPRDDHAVVLALMALELQEGVKKFKGPDGKPLQFRVGLHTGTVVAGVVGYKMPRYHLFGETVGLAQQMEGSGGGEAVNVTEAFKDALQRYTNDPRTKDFQFTRREQTANNQSTYWLSRWRLLDEPEETENAQNIRTFLENYLRPFDMFGVSALDLQLVMSRLGFGLLPYRRIHNLLDKDGDGLVDTNHLVHVLVQLVTRSEAGLRFVFDLYDWECSGALKQREMQKMLRHVSLASTPKHIMKNLIDNIFRDADTSKDGEISYDEFRRVYDQTEVLGKSWLVDPLKVALKKGPPIKEVFPSDKMAMDVKDFEVFLQKYGLSFLPASALHCVFDADKNGIVDMLELMDGINKLKGEIDEACPLVFQIFDLKRQGAIERDDMEEIFGSLQLGYLGLTATLVEDLFARVDTDNSGTISWELFKQAAAKEPLLSDWILQCSLLRNPEVPSCSQSNLGDNTPEMVDTPHYLILPALTDPTSDSILSAPPPLPQLSPPSAAAEATKIPKYNAPRRLRPLPPLPGSASSPQQDDGSSHNNISASGSVSEPHATRVESAFANASLPLSKSSSPLASPRSTGKGFFRSVSGFFKVNTQPEPQ